MTLEALDLTLGYGGPPIVRNLSVSIPSATVTAIIGPNGCGKSTLLRGLGGLIPARSGRVLLGDEDLARLRPAAIARRVTLLPQSPTPPEGIRVAELVSRGRTPWLRPFRPMGARDRYAIHQAMEATAIADLRDHRVSDLSGGQRQRVWIAMALAQETGWLLLDEPTTWLDLRHQLDLLKLLRRFNRDDNRSIVMVLHDISQAARFADHVIAMRDGEILAQGTPAQVISAEVLEQVFGLASKVIDDPLHGSPLVLPM
ncbi:ABC transporter ATP-binding protein [Paracoccus saliphilus]|uniref:ABC transporter ATP-binding protein n=1 Tax=Paracoccus saliphilus TaxID=405559 RepID=A0AA46A6K0_9RHOB|nr:ABC transporter ATP-binding protein [Paracoccus saliphilus]WCR01525.1 ABC transporter ATP-binding protein [Paracoccus saliphilus]SIS99252.1 iron complex transport system ATP-binding protein [Paracoccus saliphilus]